MAPDFDGLKWISRRELQEEFAWDRNSLTTVSLVCGPCKRISALEVGVAIEKMKQVNDDDDDDKEEEEEEQVIHPDGARLECSDLCAHCG